MTVNCRYGRADAHAIVREVRQRHIDVLATQETTDDLVERLREAGLDSLLPHRQLGTSRPTDNGGYNALFSRFEPSRSAANLIDIKSFLQLSTIGPDKLNQLRHARFFKNDAGLLAHMKKHAAILKPKFDAVLEVLDTELGGTGGRGRAGRQNVVD